MKAVRLFSFLQFKLLLLLSDSYSAAQLTSAWLVLELGTLGAWWLRADRHASIRCIAPISSAIRLSSTPSSVVNGVVLNKLRNTWKGRVGSTFAEGDCRIWPRLKNNKITFFFHSSILSINLSNSLWRTHTEICQGLKHSYMASYLVLGFSSEKISAGKECRRKNVSLFPSWIWLRSKVIKFASTFPGRKLSLWIIPSILLYLTTLQVIFLNEENKGGSTNFFFFKHSNCSKLKNPHGQLITAQLKTSCSLSLCSIFL